MRTRNTCHTCLDYFGCMKIWQKPSGAECPIKRTDHRHAALLHIADVLTVKSTDFDYFKAAIECALGMYKPIEPHTIACTGIYFHCQQNRDLEHLFKMAKSAEWCISNTVMDSQFQDANTNVEASDSGYIIYCANHKITNKDA